MSTSHYDLVFQGLLEGFGPQERQVREDFARLFSAPETTVGKVFERHGIVIKRDVDLATAERYADKLAAIGVSIQLRPAGSASGSHPAHDLATETQEVLDEWYERTKSRNRPQSFTPTSNTIVDP
jgi:hypothetical protein